MYDKTEQEIMKNWKGDALKPVVSIPTITYNHEKYISEAIDGLLMQETNFPFEVVVGEDCSLDGTRKIVEKYIEKYPNIIRLVTSENNVGMHLNGIRTIKVCKGEYVAICEGDDYWTDPLKLQNQVDFLEKNEEYGMVHTNFDTYYQDSNYFLKNTHSVYNIDIKDNCTLEYWNLFGKAMATIKTLTVCIRRDLTDEWLSVTPESKWLIGDFPMYFYASLHSKIGYINESTSVYRTAPNGSASNVGNDSKKKLKIKKTYVDIRLHFFVKYKLDEKTFKKALIRDFNLLFDYCIITGNEVVLDEYFEILTNLKWQHAANKLSRIYSKSNSPTKKLFLQYLTKIKLFILERLIKLFNRKLLVTSLQRKLFCI